MTGDKASRQVRGSPLSAHLVNSDPVNRAALWTHILVLASSQLNANIVRGADGTRFRRSMERATIICVVLPINTPCCAKTLFFASHNTPMLVISTLETAGAVLPKYLPHNVLNLTTAPAPFSPNFRKMNPCMQAVAGDGKATYPGARGGHTGVTKQFSIQGVSRQVCRRRLRRRVRVLVSLH